MGAGAGKRHGAGLQHVAASGDRQRHVGVLLHEQDGDAVAPAQFLYLIGEVAARRAGKGPSRTISASVRPATKSIVK